VVFRDFFLKKGCTWVFYDEISALALEKM